MTYSDPLHFVVIPLRLQSKRLPEKILREVAHKKTLCELVIEKALEGTQLCQKGTQLIIAVDHKRTQTFLSEKFPDITIILTDPKLPSGTDRVRSAVDLYLKKFQLGQSRVHSVINLQGDMPFFDPKTLAHLQNNLLKKSAQNSKISAIATLCQKWPMDIDPNSPQDVKVVFDSQHKALYFSRFPIPCSREYSFDALHLHIGLYAYTPTALELFCQSSAVPIEKLEGLEQLRALHLGIPIYVEVLKNSEKQYSFKGIDSVEDLKWAENFNAKRK